MKRTRTNTDRDQFKPDQYLIASDAIAFGMDPIYFEAPACRFVSIWHRFGLARIGIQPPTPGFGSFRYHFVPDRCVVVTDTTFFAPIRWGPAPRKPSKRCRRVTLNNNNSTMNHFNQKEVPMTRKVIVLTGFAKLSDAEALATAGAVIKGIYVDKVFAAPPF